MSVSDSLLQTLRGITGPDGVLTSAEARLAYESDALSFAKGSPDLIVIPRAASEVAPVVRALAAAGVPFLPRGAGTGLAGGACADRGGALIVLSRLRRILELEPADGYAVVEAGVVNLQLTRAAEPHGLLFAPDPGSQQACTIGGNVANNSGGPHTLKSGVTTNHVLGLEVVLPDGECVSFGGKAEDAPGLDLRGLFVGSEGTLGIVTTVTVRLTRPWPAWKTLLAAFPDFGSASRAVSAVIGAGIVPAALEMMDRLIVRAVEDAFHVGLPVDAGAILIVEVDGPREGLDRVAGEVERLCRTEGAGEVRVARTEAERAALWSGRKRAAAAVGRISPFYCMQDIVVPRSRLPEMAAAIGEIERESGVAIANLAHAGDGNMHPLVLFDDADPGQVARMQSAVVGIMRRAIALGGTVTGEHGIGLQKTALLPEMFGAADLDLMVRVKELFDPKGLANPGKVVPTGGWKPGAEDPRAG